MEAPGLMLQMDGSTHRWFGDKKSCLITMIDDANSDIHAEFFPSETTEGCMKVMRSVVEKYGVFKKLPEFDGCTLWLKHVLIGMEALNYKI